jgi:hypothetical protein
MKKLSVLCGALLLFGASSNAQLIDEKDVTITMDLQPILQLEMSTSDQLDFVFDDVSDYYAGITKYGATQLRVSASVNWDLYAIGRSTDGTHWDQQLQYGNPVTGASTADLPLGALELRQSETNPVLATGILDYSAAFVTYNPNGTTVGKNSIYFNPALTIPAGGQQYIAGNAGTGALNSVPGGSYLTQAGASSDYFYVMDYRILPGLPARFPLAMTAGFAATDSIVAPSYAQPGIYTMYVQYILLEDQ